MEVTKSRESGESNLKVIARFRPLIAIEKDLAESKSMEINYISETTVGIAKPQDGLETFSFDRVFSSDSSQEDIFEFVGAPIIEDVLTGYNGTVFAYGQTGSGKTYTMMGGKSPDEGSYGIIPRATGLIFRRLAMAATDIEYTIKCSMLEIYKETLRDLLGPGSELKIKQDKRRGIWVEGLTEVCLVCEEEMMEVLTLGESNRTVASTKMNTASSRSHQLFIVELNQKLPNGSEKRGILNLVDLAGSEKINQTGVTGNKLEEAKKINLSLSALGNVIKALTDHAEHIPYRDSKLTRLLQESLGGNYKTTLIVNCSPHPRNLDDTINTLKFAQRAKTIKNKATLNIKKSPEAYMRIIEELKKQLVKTTQELDDFKTHTKINSQIIITEDNSLSLGEDEELLLQPRFSYSKIDENVKVDELLENINALKQDQEYYSVKIKELEEELNDERKKRIKTEKNCFEYTSKYHKLSDTNFNIQQAEDYCREENVSLKSQVQLLKFHLKSINQRFAEYIEKIKNGEAIKDWEFTNMNHFVSGKNAELSIFSDEDSLAIVNNSEFAIDIPVNETILLANDKYAQRLCENIENDSGVSKDLLVFQVKKQFIQSGIINCELSRAYYELLWKYKLIREKMNLRSKVIMAQKERIITLEKMVNSLHNSFNKLMEIVENLEKDQAHHEKPNDLAGKGKFIRYLKSPITPQPPEELVNVRKELRMGTSAPFKLNPNLKRYSLQVSNSWNKQLYLESDLQMQMLYNQQLKKSNETLIAERNSYKQLLDDLSKENSQVYAREKDRWKEFIEDFKQICEQELVRKQMEINKLNELLGEWVHKYIEIDDSVVNSRKNLDFEQRVSIEYLLKETKIHVRPTKLFIQESPLHCRFKSNASMHISNISGDSSPPNFD